MPAGGKNAHTQSDYEIAQRGSSTARQARHGTARHGTASAGRPAPAGPLLGGGRAVVVGALKPPVVVVVGGAWLRGDCPAQRLRGCTHPLHWEASAAPRVPRARRARRRARGPRPQAAAAPRHANTRPEDATRAKKRIGQARKVHTWSIPDVLQYSIPGELNLQWSSNLSKIGSYGQV